MKRVVSYVRYWWPSVLSRIQGPFALLGAKDLFFGLRDFSTTAVKSNGEFDASILRNARLDDHAAKKISTLGTLTFKLAGITDLAVSLGGQLRELSEQLAASRPGGELGEVDGLNVVFGNRSMSELIGSGDPVANVRSGEDAGMIDLYNVDNFLPEARKILEVALESGVHDFLTGISGKELVFKSMNAYVNAGVTNTRGFHVDAYGVKQYKMFIYLTDVSDFESGPYCYVLGSPGKSYLEKANRFIARLLKLSSTDLTLLDFQNAIPIFGEVGTVIISDQSGAHRGFPQSRDGFRAICVLNFFST
jgi:hypothetical protein